MKTSTTVIWLVVALLLAALIGLYERHFQPVPPTVATLLPGLRAEAVTGIQIFPAGASEIRVRRTNQLWQLEKPTAYPAQLTAIQALLEALEKLTPTTRLTAGELSGKKTEAEFGLETPLLVVGITAGERQWQLRVGGKTAPGDGVFLSVIGTEGLFVTGTEWLALLPAQADDWRDRALVSLAGTVDWIVITNGAKTMELRRDPTNHLWRMTRPLVARADGERIVTALQQLQTAQIAQFVTNNPHADLANYGLQPAELTVWLGRGTNAAAAIQVGKSLPEDPVRVYVQRAGWEVLATATKEVFAPWRGTVNDFRDRHLLLPVATVAEIEVRQNDTNGFTLQNCGSNGWCVVGENFPVDQERIGQFAQLLYGLRVMKFEKDYNTPLNLQNFGLATPARQITLRSAVGDTNSTVAQLRFSAVLTNVVYGKRTDEEYVYAFAPEDIEMLPQHGWQFRERRLWNFSVTNLAQLTVRQHGQTRQMLHNGRGKWAFAPGSQGILDPVGVEESALQLSSLSLLGWAARNPAAPEQFGLTPAGWQITLELKSGEQFTVDLGAEISSTAWGAVTLAGERWVGVLPPTVYQLLTTFLTIPTPAP